MIPKSLNRCEEAMIVATELLQKIENCSEYTDENLTWDKANVQSLETFDHIVFTDVEKLFFDDLLAQLTSKCD